MPIFSSVSFAEYGVFARRASCCLFFGAIFGFFAACGGSKGKKDISEPPQRDGTELVAYDPIYTDHKPLLNAAGTKLVFISGRAAVGQPPSYKAYRADWPVGSAPSEPKRLTNDKKPSVDAPELEVAISSSGDWTAVIAVQDDQTDLWLVRYKDGEALQVTNDEAIESAPSFSSDDKILSWQTFDPVTKIKNVSIVDVSSAPAALKKPTQMTKDADGVSGPGFWIPDQLSPYAYMIELAGSENLSASRFEKRTFTDVTAAASATSLAWLDNLLLLGSQTAVKGSAINAIFILDSSGKVSIQSGDLEQTTATTQVVKNEVAFYAYDSATPTTFENPPGYSVLSVDIAKSGDIAFWVEREIFLCKEDTNKRLATVLVAGSSAVTAVKRYIPRMKAEDGEWEVANGLCDTTRIDTTVGHLDDKVMSAVVASNATPAKFRAAYVTRFTYAFDASCILKTGDPEVMVMDVDGATKTIYPLSKNQAPISDDDRGGKAACE